MTGAFTTRISKLAFGLAIALAATGPGSASTSPAGMADAIRLRPKTGTIAWRISLAATPATPSLVDASEKIFLVPVPGLGFEAYDIASGRFLWRRMAGDLQTDAVAGETFYVNDRDEGDGSLVALDVRNGREKWRISGAAEDLAADTRGIVIRFLGKLMSYDTAGHPLWAIDTGDDTTGNLWLIGDVVMTTYSQQEFDNGTTPDFLEPTVDGFVDSFARHDGRRIGRFLGSGSIGLIGDRYVALSWKGEKISAVDLTQARAARAGEAGPRLLAASIPCATEPVLCAPQLAASGSDDFLGRFGRYELFSPSVSYPNRDDRHVEARERDPAGSIGRHPLVVTATEGHDEPLQLFGTARAETSRGLLVTRSGHDKEMFLIDPALDSITSYGIGCWAAAEIASTRDATIVKCVHADSTEEIVSLR